MNEVIYTEVGKTINILFNWDGYISTPPIIKNITNQNLTTQPNFPQYMNYIGVGMFSFEFNIPFNISYVGTTLINIEYGLQPLSKLYQIIIRPPFGLSGNNIINPIIMK